MVEKFPTVEPEWMKVYKKLHGSGGLSGGSSTYDPLTYLQDQLKNYATQFRSEILGLNAQTAEQSALIAQQQQALAQASTQYANLNAAFPAQQAETNRRKQAYDAQVANRDAYANQLNSQLRRNYETTWGPMSKWNWIQKWVYGLKANENFRHAESMYAVTINDLFKNYNAAAAVSNQTQQQLNTAKQQMDTSRAAIQQAQGAISGQTAEQQAIDQQIEAFKAEQAPKTALVPAVDKTAELSIKAAQEAAKQLFANGTMVDKLNVQNLLNQQATKIAQTFGLDPNAVSAQLQLKDIAAGPEKVIPATMSLINKELADWEKAATGAGSVLTDQQRATKLAEILKKYGVTSENYNAEVARQNTIQQLPSQITQEDFERYMGNVLPQDAPEMVAQRLTQSEVQGGTAEDQKRIEDANAAAQAQAEAQNEFRKQQEQAIKDAEAQRQAQLKAQQDAAQEQFNQQQKDYYQVGGNLNQATLTPSTSNFQQQNVYANVPTKSQLPVGPMQNFQPLLQNAIKSAATQGFKGVLNTVKPDQIRPSSMVPTQVQSMLGSTQRQVTPRPIRQTTTVPQREQQIKEQVRSTGTEAQKQAMGVADQATSVTADYRAATPYNQQQNVQMNKQDLDVNQQAGRRMPR